MVTVEQKKIFFFLIAVKSNKYIVSTVNASFATISVPVRE